MAESNTSSTLLVETKDILKERVATLEQRHATQNRRNIALVVIVGALIVCQIGSFSYLATISNAELQLPPANHVEYVLQNGNEDRTKKIKGKYLTAWEIATKSGNTEIASATDDKYAIIIKKSGLYYIGVQVIFKNKAPHNYVHIFVNGREWKRTAHSSPMQLNKDGEVQESFVPARLSSPGYFNEGDRLTVSLGHRGKQISVLHKDTFLDIVEMR